MMQQEARTLGQQRHAIDQALAATERERQSLQTAYRGREGEADYQAALARVQRFEDEIAGQLQALQARCASWSPQIFAGIDAQVRNQQGPHHALINLGELTAYHHHVDNMRQETVELADRLHVQQGSTQNLIEAAEQAVAPAQPRAPGA
jgi:hypothetical protein